MASTDIFTVLVIGDGRLDQPPKSTQPPKPAAKGPEGGPDLVARWLRSRRQELGLSTSELARRIGVTPAFVSMVESGRKRPGPDTARKLARALFVPEGAVDAWLNVYNPKNIEGSWRALSELLQHVPHELRELPPLGAAGDEFAGFPSLEKEMWARGPVSRAEAEDLVRRALASRAPPVIDPSMPPEHTREPAGSLSTRRAAPFQERRELVPGEAGLEPAKATSALERLASENPALENPALLGEIAGRMLGSSSQLPPSLLLSRGLRGRARGGVARRFNALLERLAGGPREAQSREMLPVPLVAEGTAPGERTGGRATAMLRLDPALLPSGRRVVEPFAYRLSEDGTRFARGVLKAGDVVILSRDIWPLRPEGFYAVRMGGRVVISRVAVKGNSLVVIPTEPGTGIELLPLDEPSKPPPQLIGHVILMMRQPA